IVHRLAERALAVADTGVARGDRVPDLRAQLARSCAQERSDLAAAQAGVVKHALQLLPRKEGWVVTLSRSGLVEAALIGARKAGYAVRALVGEGRPRLEGRDLAARLAEAKIPVWLVTDAMLPLVLTQSQALWLGADAVTEHGVLN